MTTNRVTRLGADQGTGTVQATDPDQRKVCTYDSGLFLSVELGDEYMVGVTLGTGGQSVGEAVAQAMLAAL